MKRHYLKQVIAATLSVAMILTTMPAAKDGTAVYAEELQESSNESENIDYSIMDTSEMIGEAVQNDRSASEAEVLTDAYIAPDGETADMQAEEMPKAPQGYQLEGSTGEETVVTEGTEPEEETPATTEEVPTEEETSVTTEEVPTEEETSATTEEVPTEKETSATTEEMPTEKETSATMEEVPIEEETSATTEEVPTEEETSVTTEEVLTEEEQPVISATTVDMYPEVAGGTCGEKLTWSLSNGTLTIKGTGAMTEYGYDNRPWENDINSIKKVVIRNGVTTISPYAFYKCEKLQSVTIPQSVQTIGKILFAECAALKTVSLPAKVTTIPYACFANCTELQSIEMPGVTTIDDYAFQGLNMPSMQIGKKVTKISYLAFASARIKAYTVESGNPVYTSKNGVIYADKGKTLYAYPAGSTASSFAIPSGVTKIGDAAFIQAKYLMAVTFPSSVKTLGSSAFQGSGLRSVTIPDTVTSVDNFTFYESGVKTVTFGKGLKTTAYEMFEKCRELGTINFGGIQELDARTFAYCSSLENVTIPAGVKRIGNGTFGECWMLETVTIQGTLNCIPFQAFLNCSSLKNVIITGKVPNIYRASFLGCRSLKSITLPKTTTYVHPWAFETGTEIHCLNAAMKPFGKHGYRQLDTVSINGKYYYSKAYEVLNLVNRERAKNGLGKLYMNQELLETAMTRAGETAVCFSHTRPDSSLCFELNMDMSAENIAAGQTSAAAAMDSWMNSQGHRENILSKEVSNIGIGCFYHNGTYYWVQCFGTGSDSSNCKKPADTSKTQTIQIADSTFSDAAIGAGISFSFGEQKEYSYSMKLVPETTVLSKGQTTKVKVLLKNAGIDYWYATLNNSGITWTSSDQSTMAVSAGKVTAKKDGTATIKASLKYYSAKVNVGSKQLTKVEQFVSRLYTKCLKRSLDTDGLKYWNDMLVSKQKSGAEVGYGFVFSDEYKAKKTTDKQFITMLYQVFMDREPDQAGLTYWTGLLKDGVSREYVYHGFATSQEYTNICNSYGITRGTITLKQARDKNINLTRFVTRIYDKALARSWDESGLNYWCGQIQSGAMTPTQVAENFIYAKEFTDKHLSNTEYVKVLYRTFMGREADNAGLNYWVGRLNKGESRKTVLKSFAGCPEFKNIVKSFGL